jgi:plasmid maintenance system antidote protein VapI
MGEFTDNIVNQRFRNIYAALEKQSLIKGKSDIAAKLGTYNHVINSVLKGERNITVEQMGKLIDLYNLRADFLFGITNEMFVDGIAARPNAQRAWSGRQNITLVAEKALAGYATALNTPQYLADFPRFSLPNMEGNLLAFEISGNSMEPTITNGDTVICEALERGEPIRDNQIYVIVTDVVVAKRVQQIKEDNQVRGFSLISDNALFKPYAVSTDEVRQILRVKCRLTENAIQ